MIGAEHSSEWCSALFHDVIRKALPTVKSVISSVKISYQLYFDVITFEFGHPNIICYSRKNFVSRQASLYMCAFIYDRKTVQ